MSTALRLDTQKNDDIKNIFSEHWDQEVAYKKEDASLAAHSETTADTQGGGASDPLVTASLQSAKTEIGMEGTLVDEVIRLVDDLHISQDDASKVAADASKVAADASKVAADAVAAVDPVSESSPATLAETLRKIMGNGNIGVGLAAADDSTKCHPSKKQRRKTARAEKAAGKRS